MSEWECERDNYNVRTWPSSSADVCADFSPSHPLLIQTIHPSSLLESSLCPSSQQSVHPGAGVGSNLPPSSHLCPSMTIHVHPSSHPSMSIHPCPSIHVHPSMSIHVHPSSLFQPFLSAAHIAIQWRVCPSRSRGGVYPARLTLGTSRLLSC